MKYIIFYVIVGLKPWPCPDKVARTEDVQTCIKSFRDSTGIVFTDRDKAKRFIKEIQTATLPKGQNFEKFGIDSLKVNP